MSDTKEQELLECILFSGNELCVELPDCEDDEDYGESDAYLDGYGAARKRFAEKCKKCKLRIPSTPQWSSEMPTESGWYWVYCTLGLIYVRIRASRIDDRNPMLDIHGRSKRCVEFCMEYPEARWLEVKTPDLPKLSAVAYRQMIDDELLSRSRIY
jgi:hypothetical protein